MAPSAFPFSARWGLWRDCGRLAIMGNVGYPASVLEMGEVHATAQTLGLEVVPLEIRQAEDI
jgi:hypothetical protein